MATIPVVVKWQGKKFDVEVDTTEPGSTFKFQIFSLTGVPPERQKVLIKGGQLKDDQDMSTLNLKSGHSFMLIGTAEQGFKAPEKKTVFLEDMTSADLAKSLVQPPGLVNLGNTCYMNATLQVLRSIPEMQENLNSYTRGPAGQLQAFTTQDINSQGRELTSSLRDLYQHMSETPDAFNPARFLQMLRVAFPQFAQRSRESNAMAQQDAEECWSQIISILRTNVKNPDQQKSFIDTYMAGVMTSTLSCDESTDEPVVHATESFLKLACHIGITTNFMRDGILAALSEKIEKRSEILDRNANWTKTSRVSRLPKYLVVHFVRFYWKRDTNKKAKILRKVKFPMELDATEYCTDELKKKTLPVRDALREARHKQEEKERQRKRARHQIEIRTDVVGTDVLGAADLARMGIPDEPEEPGVDPETLVDAELKADVGSNPTGLYELAGVLTHAGSNADSGHWQGWTKQAEGDEWWRFDDSKVTSVPESKILSLDGGGEADTAYSTLPVFKADSVLLYRAKEFPKRT